MGAPKSVEGLSRPVEGTEKSGRTGVGPTGPGILEVPVSTSGFGPFLDSPAEAEHSGHASGPWDSSTRSATAICCDRLARSGRSAYSSPPAFFHCSRVNWRPP